MKKQALIAAFLMTAITTPAVFAHDWWEGKYEHGHHYTWDEWRDHRSSWEAEHRAERHWNEEEMRREWERHKHHYHY
jgi:hypothetical protein